MRKTLFLIGLLAFAGCAREGASLSATQVPSVRQILQAEIDQANAAAEQVLAEFNESESAPRFGGPFRLSDYEITLSEFQRGGRDVVSVSYRLREPVAFRGHPQHFGVWVFRDTGETQVFKGR